MTSCHHFINLSFKFEIYSFILERYVYEILEEYDGNEEIIRSYNTVRRDTGGQEPTKRPETTEQRPPFPSTSVTTRTPTVTLSTKPFSKKTVIRTMSTSAPKVPLVTDLPANTTTSNLTVTVNVSEIELRFPTVCYAT